MMKKIIPLVLTVMLSMSFTGCGKENKTAGKESKPASQSEVTTGGKNETTGKTNEPESSMVKTEFVIVESYGAFLDAKSVLTDKILDGLSNNPDTSLASLELLGVAMIDLAMLPVSFFGLGEDAVASGLAIIGASDTQYEENGNSYRVMYTDKEGVKYVFEGTYDKAADALVCKATKADRKDLYGEYRKTSFGYICQYSFTNDDNTAEIYKLSIQGENGVLGFSKAGSLTPLSGGETLDFPKDSDQWYAVSGNKITGKTSDGKDLDFTYTP